MKISDRDNTAPYEVVDWIESLKNLNDEEFMLQISQIKQWEWDDLEDLSPLIPILNRVDSLLVQTTQNLACSDLSALLDFSYIIMSSVHSLSLYNSIDELSQILDLPS